MFILTEAQRQHWTAHGWLLLSHSLSLEVTQALSAWVEAMTRKARDREQRLHSYERTAQGKTLCQVERFLDDHAQLRSLITEGTLPMIAATLLGERAIIYKEKIDCKHAGGTGYAPHQDAAAYRYVNYHVTCLVAVDAMTPDNGCLAFALGHPQRLLRRDSTGCIDPQIADKLEWIRVPVPAGGVLFFSSYAAHRSGPNCSMEQRRALYLTYNAVSEGNLREAYYQDRDRQLAALHAEPAAGTGLGDLS
jgi:ectoine hydroxylase-related dioxygenase (phytanoyl-CoA dioxygenase family)